MFKTLFTITGNIGFILILWLVYICYNTEDNEGKLQQQLFNKEVELQFYRQQINETESTIMEYSKVLHKCINGFTD